MPSSVWDDDLPPIAAGDEDLELVGAALRRALVQSVPASVADAHVRAMVAAHAESGARRWSPRRTRPAMRPQRFAPLLGGIAAAGLAAAFVGGALPLHDGGNHHVTRVATPAPVTTTTLPTTTVESVPSTLAPVTTAPPVVTASPTTEAPTTSLAPSTTAAPPTTTRVEPTTTSPASTTTTTAGRNGCVNPAIISATATLINGGTAVQVSIRTSGTLPYLSATIDGMTGVVANLQPTSFGFEGTVTAPTTIPVGSLLVYGACGLRGSVAIQ